MGDHVFHGAHCVLNLAAYLAVTLAISWKLALVLLSLAPVSLLVLRVQVRRGPGPAPPRRPSRRRRRRRCGEDGEERLVLRVPVRGQPPMGPGMRGRPNGGGGGGGGGGCGGGGDDDDDS